MSPEAKKGRIGTIFNDLLRGRRENQRKLQGQKENIETYSHAKQFFVDWGLTGYETPFYRFIQSKKGKIFFYAPEFDGPIVDAYSWNSGYVVNPKEKALFYQSGVPHHKDTGVWPLSGMLILHAIWPNAKRNMFYEIAIKTSFDPSFTLQIASAAGITSITEENWARTQLYSPNTKLHLAILRQHLLNPFKFSTDFNRIERNAKALNTNRVNALFKTTHTSQQLALPK